MNRREMLRLGGASFFVVSALVNGKAFAQSKPASAKPVSQTVAPVAPARFSFDDVLRRAREVAAKPYELVQQTLPDPFKNLDFDTWRDIRFRPERAFLSASKAPFRLQLLHAGFLHKRTVEVNVIKDGVATSIPYTNSLFDYGKLKVEKPLPVNLGFAGVRVHHALNDPRYLDELISFIGGSYFRFLSRGQKYGLSARGLAIRAGLPNEEFPFFTHFWVETPEHESERVVIYAQMDSNSLTGAYQFIIYPGETSVVDVTATVFARKVTTALGIAPLTSMFVSGENDRRVQDDYRPEQHDSDGLLMHSGKGEWIWRPLRNPADVAVSAFQDVNPRGFGLMQRDRVFDHYQDPDLSYEKRPSYWVEPLDQWGEGSINLVEIPTNDETNDNIVAYWVPKTPLEAGQSLSMRYRLKSYSGTEKLDPGGRVSNTFRTKARALGSSEPVMKNQVRMLVDFTGGDLGFHLAQPHDVQVVASTTSGVIKRAFLIPQAEQKRFRAAIDIELVAGQQAELRAFLKTGSKALSETWTYPLKGE